ncbi:MAG: DUF6232 family protein [Thermoanaerobaculia bacterium]
MADAVEKVFFERGAVRVTNSRFQVESQTYAMSAVNSVNFLKEPASMAGAGCLLAFGAFVLLGGLVSFSTGAKGAGAFALLFGGAAVALGIMIARSLKHTYIVLLRTSNGEVKALRSKDSEYINAVVQALNDAIVARG